MKFQNPEILYFLALLIIPILVHLFQLQRFVKVPFTNVAFLQKLALQTRKSSRLKKWLILATRTLGLLAIVFSFSQPYFSSNKSIVKQNNFIYLDNSLSLDSKGEKGNLYKIAVQEIIDNISDKESYSLATNTDYYDDLSSTELKKILLNTKNSASRTEIKDILLKINDKKTNSTKTSNKNIIISDLQNININNFTNVNSVLSIVKLNSAQKNNLSIDSLYLKEVNGKNATINVIIKNQGEAKNNIPIALFNSQKLLNKQLFSIEKNTKKTISFNFQNTTNIEGKIQITFSDIFSFDNTYLFTLNSEQKTNVLSIGKASSFLSKIYQKKEFNFSNYTVKNLNYNNIAKQQLIILNEIKNFSPTLEKILVDFHKNGGHLVIIPNKDILLNSYNSLFKKLNIGKIDKKRTNNLKITQIHYNHPFFKNVFSKKVANFQYPEINTHYSTSLKNSSKIISLEDNSSFLQEAKSNTFYLFNSPLEKSSSNFSNSPLIVPVFYNFAKLSLQHSQLYYTINTNNEIDIETKLNKDDILSIVNKETSFIPLQQTYQNKVKLTTKEQPLVADFYNIISKKDTLTTIAYNYPKEESSLNFLDLNQLKDQKNITAYSSIADFFKENNKKNKVTWLWKWFLALAIVSLLLEILILKFLKP